MSCVAIVCNPDTGLYLAGDGICYAESGEIISFVSKIGHLSEFGCAYGACGLGLMGESFASVVRGWHLRDFDDLVSKLSDVTRVTFDLACDLNPIAAKHKPQTSIAVGGYSLGRQRFELYRVSNVDRDQVDLDGNLVRKVGAFEPIQRNFYISEGGLTRDLTDRFGFSTETDDLLLAARAVCACRSMSGKALGDNPMIYQAGCFLELAVLTRDGFSSQIVHRWPEGIGDRVDPSAGEALPASVFGTESHAA